MCTMPTKVRLESVEFASVKVTDATEWIFAHVFDREGRAAVTEITCRGEIRRAVALLAAAVATLRYKDIGDESQVATLLRLTTAELCANHPLATAVSGLRTAVVDIQAQRDDVSMTQVLGGEPQSNVRLYANINRALLVRDRTPAAFGAVAERAARDGFTVVKCAPFDEVRPPAAADHILDIARPGLQRVAAVRAAVGPDVQVLVDCHSRFEAHTAPLVAEELARLDVGWFEEPLQPTVDIEGLIQVAEKVSIPLAGGESGYGEDFFTDLVRRGAVKVVMPDIKWCGGVVEACHAGRAATDAGGQVSLHGPSSPVSQLAGAHVTAAMPGALALEHGVYEAPWRPELVMPPERVEGGRLWFPDGKGLGATLNPDVVKRYGSRWKE